MEHIFYDDNGRVRSGWRFALFISLFLFAMFPVVSVWAYVLSLVLPSGTDSAVSRLAFSVVPLAIAVLLGWLCGRLLEDLPFRALGISLRGGWIKDLLIGIALGAAAISLAVAISALFGGLRFQINQNAGIGQIAAGAAAAFAVFTVGSALEEALVRGYMFQTFVRSGLAWVALAITSLFFASLHLTNPEAGFFSFANTALAGIWLGTAYLKTRTLWLPIGLHLAWNWLQGSLYGIEVSGLTDLAENPVLIEFDSGPVWLTGGEYGLEGGAACTIALIAVTAAVWFSPFLKADDEMVALTSPPEAGSGTEQT